jgi:hypothetical protein
MPAETGDSDGGKSRRIEQKEPESGHRNKGQPYRQRCERGLLHG